MMAELKFSRHNDTVVIYKQKHEIKMTLARRMDDQNQCALPSAFLFRTYLATSRMASTATAPITDGIK